MVAALREDSSSWALIPANDDRLLQLASTGDAYAAAGIPDGTMGADAAGWRKWKRFLGAEFKGADPWRKDPEVQRGDVRATQRECTALALFYLWVFASIKPRGRGRRKGKPQSALNNVAAVRRIHRRARFPMPPCPMLADMLKGMNDEYCRLHGDRRALLPQRKEPLRNEYFTAMLRVPDGTRLQCGVVDWAAPNWAAFAAAVSSMRMTGWRAADALSLDGFVGTYDLTRDDVSWFVSVPSSPSRAIVRMLPPDYVLQDGDCAILNPGGSKNDRTGETFGTQPMYIPFVSGDANTAPLWLQRYERIVPCPPSERKRTALFSCAGGLPLSPTAARAMFHDLAVAALGDDIAATISLHSCRVWLACALLACEADDPLIQAMARWKTPESCHIYGRLNPQSYAQWLRRASSAATTSQQVTSLPQLDDDEAHVSLGETIAVLATTDVEAECDPPSGSEDDERDGGAGGADHDGAEAGARAIRPRRAAVPLDARIQVQQENPKRAGSAAHARFELYKSATSKAEFIALGGTTADFAYDVDREFVRVVR